MMTFLEILREAEEMNKSSLCVGLDPDPSRFPEGVSRSRGGIFDFCARIVEETADLAIAFKPQIAYFAANGAEVQLEKLIKEIRIVAPRVPVILDAKRGDIGSTAEQYAKEAFERYGADAVTLNPYLGPDTIQPYMAEQYAGKGLFLLCKTSNPGSDYLQNQLLKNGLTVYEYIAQGVGKQPSDSRNSLGLVVGATYPEELERVRQLARQAPLLVPGVGKQGGDAATVIHLAWWTDAPVVVNSSSAILYAASDKTWRTAARKKAKETRDVMEVAKHEKIARRG